MSTIAQPTAPAPNQLLDYQELSIWLNDSVRHLRRLVNERRIPYIKVGHFVRFDPEQVHRWLEDNANAPITGAPVTAVPRSRPSRQR